MGYHQTIHEAQLYEKRPKRAVRCGLCERRCLIPLGQKGYCKTRANMEGKLYTLVYGNLSSLESRPIEIKPFYHYWPGSSALTFSTWSCNFDCPWCQNYHLSKTEPNPVEAGYYPPKTIVAKALVSGCAGLCASFQEPTLLTDWVASLFRLGREKGLYCCYVSNGYMTSEALTLLCDSGLDGLKVDLKGDAETYQKYCGGIDVEKVWRNVRDARNLGLHVEIVNLVITGVNDNEDCLKSVIERHLKEAGAETPLHFTRYFPAYNFNNPPTRVETLENAYEIARKAGVLYPYLGNVGDHKYGNTYCPMCGERLIQRASYTVRSYRISIEKKCQICGHEIPITGRYAS